MLKKPIGFRVAVMWSVESKVNLFGSDGKVIAWRTPKEEYDLDCILPIVKHYDGSVTAWSCFRNMDRFYYRDILEKYLLPSIKRFKPEQDFFYA